MLEGDGGDSYRHVSGENPTREMREGPADGEGTNVNRNI